MLEPRCFQTSNIHRGRQKVTCQKEDAAGATGNSRSFTSHAFHLHPNGLINGSVLSALGPLFTFDLQALRASTRASKGVIRASKTGSTERIAQSQSKSPKNSLNSSGFNQAMKDREVPDSESTHGRIFPTVYTAWESPENLYKRGGSIPTPGSKTTQMKFSHKSFQFGRTSRSALPSRGSGDRLDYLHRSLFGAWVPAARIRDETRPEIGCWHRRDGGVQ